MKVAEAKKLYNDNWAKDFVSLEALYERIRLLSDNGAYSMCVYIDSRRTYLEVKEDLATNGFAVEDYNGGNNGILQVSWC